jgi:hypothetical protein
MPAQNSPVTDRKKSFVSMRSIGDISHKGKRTMSGAVLRAISTHHGCAGRLQADYRRSLPAFLGGLLFIPALLLPAVALAEQQCFPASKVRDLRDIGFLDRVSIAPHGRFVVVQTRSDISADIYRLPSGELRRIAKQPGVALHIVDENEIAFENNGRFVAVNVNTGKRRSLAGAPPVSKATTLDRESELLDGYRIFRARIAGGGEAHGSRSQIRIASDKTLCAEVDAPIERFLPSHAAALKAFARPGGFRNGDDLRSFLAIARSRKAPSGLVAASLLGILYYSDALFNTLVREGETGADFARLDTSFLNARQAAEIGHHVREYLTRVFRIADIRYEALQRRAPLVRRFFDEAGKRKLMDIVSYRAVEDMHAIPELSDVDPYKVFAFAYSAAGRLFASTDAIHFTDLSVFQTPTSLTFTQFGTSPLPGGAVNAFGFFTKRLQTLPAAKITRARRLEWTWPQGKSIYRAVFSLDRMQQSAPPSETRRFPKPGRHGLIVLSSNMERDLIEKTIAAYVVYFHRAGFIFNRPRTARNLESLLKARLSASRDVVDYMIKEAHSDSDENNMMSVPRNGYSLKGAKTGPSSEHETIEIVYNAGEAATRRISYQQFAEWLRKRVAAGAPPLVNIDASCWSYVKIVSELGWSMPAELLAIGTLGPTNLMSLEEESAGDTLLDGIRGGATFDEVRASLKRQSGYASGLDDQYVFPDEEKFHALIASEPEPPLRILRRLFVREAGQPEKKYTPDGY